MKARRFLLVFAALALLSCSTKGLSAQEAGENMTLEGVERVDPLNTLEKPAVKFSESETSQSDVRESKITIAELRQARALRQADQRRARLEYNLWIGYEPLRPNWSSSPMTNSRYGNHRIYVPLFVR
jgi:hypothetical protein